MTQIITPYPPMGEMTIQVDLCPQWGYNVCNIVIHEVNIMIADATVKARIPRDVKDRAVLALEKMGLNTSDVIRMVMMRVADEGKLPFEVKTPNKKTLSAMSELDEGKGKSFDSVDSLFDDLGI